MSTPPDTIYIARHWLIGPVIGVLTLMAAVAYGIAVGLGAIKSGNVLSTAAVVLVLAVFIVRSVYGSLRRAWASKGVMVRLDAKGVLMAGRPGTFEPQFVPWQDVRDLVLFDSAASPNAMVHYVGVRTKGGATGDFRTLRRKLLKGATETSPASRRRDVAA